MYSISLEQHSEKSIIEACCRKEKWAQAILYRELYPILLGVCIRYAKNREDATDVLHDGFIKIFDNIHKYKIGTSLEAWAKRIMVNNSIDHYRKMSRRRTSDIDEVFGVTNDDPSVLDDMSQKEILALVQKLPDSYRLVFNMYVVEGFSHKEIAEQLNVRESTSRTNLLKARHKLKVLLKESNINYE